MNSNRLRVWRMIFMSPNGVSIQCICCELKNVMPAEVASIIQSHPDPHIVFDRPWGIVRVQGPENERRLLYESICTEYYHIPEDCKEAVRQAVADGPKSMLEIVEATGYNRYMIQNAVEVMHDIERLRTKPQRYRRRNDVQRYKRAPHPGADRTG